MPSFVVPPCVSERSDSRASVNRSQDRSGSVRAATHACTRRESVEPCVERAS